MCNSPVNMNGVAIHTRPILGGQNRKFQFSVTRAQFYLGAEEHLGKTQYPTILLPPNNGPELPTM